LNHYLHGPLKTVIIHTPSQS